jgi:lipoprotein-releasing system permease protein
LKLPNFIASRIRKPLKASFSATVYNIGIVTIAAGLAVTILAFMILYGFKANIVQRLYSLTPELKVSKYSIDQSFEQSPISTHTQLYKNWKKIENIAHLQAVTQKAGILKAPDDLHGVLLKGVDSSYNWQQLSEQLVQGRVLHHKPGSYSTEVIISQSIAQKLHLKLGQQPILYFVQNVPRARKLNVVGIYQTNMEEFDSQYLICDQALLQRVNNWPADSVGSYEIALKNPSIKAATQQQIIQLMAPDLKLESSERQFAPIFEWLTLLDRNMLLFVVILFVVVSFNITSVLLVLILERIPTIGILKAMGIRNWDMRRIFIQLGIYMVLKGLLWGNIAALLLCYLQWQFHLIPLDAANYYISYVPISWHWPTIVIVNLAAIVLIASVLTVPTYILQRIQPSKAIQFGK